jgi:hypothetical protein
MLHGLNAGILAFFITSSTHYHTPKKSAESSPAKAGGFDLLHGKSILQAAVQGKLGNV